ncbi:YHYH protein-domain-containing protein, partial [Pelagophyceae sp. CCMP2097]
AVTCATDGSDYEYDEVIAELGARVVRTNHCPNHAWRGLNPSKAVSTGSALYSYPANPMYEPTQTVSLAFRRGSVGTLFSGAMLFSNYAGAAAGGLESYYNSATFLEGDTLDECGCHAATSATASYHCHTPPSCLLANLGASKTEHSPQIGWAADGFPVYGPRGPDGLLIRLCSSYDPFLDEPPAFCLDDCSGFHGPLPIDAFLYRYYVTGPYHDANSAETCEAPLDPLPGEAYYPFTPQCLNGCAPAGSFETWLNPCTSSAQPGYTVAYTPLARAKL